MHVLHVLTISSGFENIIQHLKNCYILLSEMEREKEMVINYLHSFYNKINIKMHFSATAVVQLILDM